MNLYEGWLNLSSRGEKRSMKNMEYKRLKSDNERKVEGLLLELSTVLEAISSIQNEAAKS